MDNCILNAEALVCVKEPPAYTFRDYRYQWCPSARASPPEGTRARWPLDWEEQGGRTTQTGLFCLWLLLCCWGSSRLSCLLELW